MLILICDFLAVAILSIGLPVRFAVKKFVHGDAQVCFVDCLGSIVATDLKNDFDHFQTDCFHVVAAEPDLLTHTGELVHYSDAQLWHAIRYAIAE